MGTRFGECVAVTCSSGTVRGSRQFNRGLVQVSEATGQRVCHPHTTHNRHRLALFHCLLFSLSWAIPSSSPYALLRRLASPLSRSTTRPHSRYSLLSVHSDRLCSDSGIFVSPLFPFSGKCVIPVSVYYVFPLSGFVLIPVLPHAFPFIPSRVLCSLTSDRPFAYSYFGGPLVDYKCSG